jgi:DNA-binding CsgD family transcriptional regulator
VLQHVIDAHEHAGDVARDRHLYENAAQHYQHALDIQEIRGDDHLRIEEKLAYALSLGDKPDAANPLLERVLTRYIKDPEGATKAVELLLQRCRQLWRDYQFKEIPRVVAQAIGIAKTARNSRLYKLANLRMAGYLNVLGRHDHAAEFLHAVGDIRTIDDVALRVSYHMQRAVQAVRLGDAKEVYDNFERAVHDAKISEDSYLLITVLHNYANSAKSLGNIEVEKTCAERALLLARQNHIGWFIPLSCLVYSGILTKMNQQRIAYDYVNEALTYDVRMPAVDASLAEFGIPIAIYMNDEVMLAKCARYQTLTLALQSGAPDSVAPVAAAFARFYGERGDAHKVQKLLHGALKIGRSAVYSLDLPLMIAAYGALPDIREARELLETRAALPSADVARAYLSLFDAYVAQRKKSVIAIQTSAKEAIERFETLHWYSYADVARSLLPYRSAPPETIQRIGPFSDLQPTLTARERQVAELVLKGLTNRTIAEALMIKETTVESHMRSIMNRLDIRSRHQLVDMLSNASTLTPL